MRHCQPLLNPSSSVVQSSVVYYSVGLLIVSAVYHRCVDVIYWASQLELQQRLPEVFGRLLCAVFWSDLRLIIASQ